MNRETLWKGEPEDSRKEAEEARLQFHAAFKKIAGDSYNEELFDKALQGLAFDQKNARLALEELEREVREEVDIRRKKMIIENWYKIHDVETTMRGGAV